MGAVGCLNSLTRGLVSSQPFTAFVVYLITPSYLISQVELLRLSHEVPPIWWFPVQNCPWEHVLLAFHVGKKIVCNDMGPQRAVMDNWLLVWVFPANLVPSAMWRKMLWRNLLQTTSVPCWLSSVLERHLLPFPRTKYGVKYKSSGWNGHKMYWGILWI